MLIRVLLLLILAVSVCGQTIDTFEVNNFAPGLNTVKNKMYLQPGEATVCHNVDLSDGSLSARQGSDSVFAFPGMDEFVGLHGAYYSWGEQQLIAALDSTGAGWGGLYASVLGGHAFGVKKDTFQISIDIDALLADPCFPDADQPLSCTYCNPFNDPCPAGVPAWRQRITYRDSTWDMYIKQSTDSATLVDSSWWVDTLVSWINSNGPGNWLTATDRNDSLTLKEDSTSLDITLDFQLTNIRQYDEYTTSASQYWPYWSTQNPTSFAMFNDKVYATNGDQRGVIWNGEIAHAYPLAAFGEPLITPIALQSGENAAYTIDGEVRYAIAASVDFAGPGDYSDSLFGVISAPVKTKNGRFLLRHFSSLADDTVALVGSGDTVLYHIYRTLSNPGTLTRTTDMYNTGIKVKIFNPRNNGPAWVYDSRTGAGDTVMFDAFDTLIVIDSMPDSVLTSIDQKRRAISDVWAGRDSTGVITRRPGTLGFRLGTTITLDTTHKIGGSGDTLCALSVGIPTQADTLGWAYAVAMVDTITGNEGPLSEFTVVLNDTNATTYKKILMFLPPLHPNDIGLVYNVYRAMIYQVGLISPAYFLDTTFVFEGRVRTLAGLRPDRIEPIHHSDGRVSPRLWWDEKYQVDTTIIWIPFLVAQLPGEDSTFVDSMRYDSLELRKPYKQVAPPARISNLFAHDGFMFGHDGSLLYRSQVDSATKWGFWDFTPVNANDGDLITAVWPTRTAIRIKKNRTSWNAFSDYGRTEINEGVGCIAPRSHVKGAAHYFLSDRGIEVETEGRYLERTLNSDLLSKNLKSFEDRTIADLSEMVGMYLPTEQIALFSLGDTTWAFFEKTGGWATWDLSFRGATLYDTEDELNFVPGKTMYFYKDDDPNLYRYGTAQTDNGDSITITWRSGAFGADRYLDVVKDIGLWVNSTDAYDSTVTVRIYGDDGAVNDSIVFPALANEAYILKGYGGKEPMYYFQIEIENSGTVSNTEINKIDFSIDTKRQKTGVR